MVVGPTLVERSRGKHDNREGNIGTCSERRDSQSQGGTGNWDQTTNDSRVSSGRHRVGGCEVGGRRTPKVQADEGWCRGDGRYQRGDRHFSEGKRKRVLGCPWQTFPTGVAVTR